MNNRALILLMSIAACGDTTQPSREDSARIWAGASSAMMKAQQQAVRAADGEHLVPFVDDVELDWTGQCELGGQIMLTGNYTGDGTQSESTWDLRTSFFQCAQNDGTLNGELRWTAETAFQSLQSRIWGDVRWQDENDEVSRCELDVSIVASGASISFGGTLCGYNMGGGACHSPFDGCAQIPCSECQPLLESDGVDCSVEDCSCSPWTEEDGDPSEPCE